jgi:hypothetical protein
MTFDPSENYGDERVCLTVEGDVQGRFVTAYCSPDADGKTYFTDGEQVGVADTSRYGAPFSVDIVLLDDVYPQEDDIQSIRDELGDEFSAQFDGRVKAVYDEIDSRTDDDEDALDVIMDIETDDLVVEED